MGETPLTDEQKAFAEKLFRDNYKLLLRRAYELLRGIDPNAAEDCLGNLFLTLCLSAEKVMAHENPTAWLFLTIKYICLKHIRGVGTATKRNVPLDETMANTVTDESDMEDKIVNDILYCQWQNEGLIKKLLNGLNCNEREILRLRFEEGLSNSEIGSRLGKSEDAVRFTIYYTKKKISEKIYSL